MALAEFLFILIVILGFAKLTGELAHRVGQPAVLGELVAGMILGASVLGFVPAVGAGGETVSLLDELFGVVGRPAAVDWFFENLIPQSESAGHFIGLLAEIGVIILLFRIGLTTNIRELSEVGVKSVMVAAAGVILPFAGGFAFCEMLDLPKTTSIFVGAALTATSIGITARILTDLGKMKTKEARIILGAAVFDDIIGLIILSVVSDLALTGVVSWGKITWTTVSAVGFFALAIVAGILLARPLIRVVVRMRVQGALIVTAICFAFVWALLAEEAGSAVIVGSFAAGLALAETDKYELFQKAFYPLSEFFTPIFFVSIGAAVNVRYFNPLRLGQPAGTTHRRGASAYRDNRQGLKRLRRLVPRDTENDRRNRDGPAGRSGLHLRRVRAPDRRGHRLDVRRSGRGHGGHDVPRTAVAADRAGANADRAFGRRLAVFAGPAPAVVYAVVIL
ncbi:MAG: cation:proton antiporter [Candidatus Coatesbacteria bacterium]|nr:MAG: cation:proton antiporter [Candidatus Coatesbacteria bacterium]